MKKLLWTAIVLVMIGTAAFAQADWLQGETPPGGEPPPGPPPGIPGKVTMPLGTLTINGVFLTGVRAQMVDQEGSFADDRWTLGAINPVFQENRAELALTYSFFNYGAFLGWRYQRYITLNSYTDASTPNTGTGGTSANANLESLLPRFAFVYANLFKDTVKLSIGKLYSQIMSVPDSRVWETEWYGPTFSFAGEDKFSIRAEYKPIPELNVGAQLFFVDDPQETVTIAPGVSMPVIKGLDKTGAWKEIGIGAQWISSTFNAEAGFRLDSQVDGIENLLGNLYLSEYYGYQLGSGAQGMDKSKHTADADSDAGSFMFFGFSYKAIKNLTAWAQAGFYNLGDFDKFGYGKLGEYVKYNNLVGKLGVGITMEQQFYGSDVFETEDTMGSFGPVAGMKNSPFLTFAPEVSYGPLTKQTITPSLTGTFGFCPDVLDGYFKIKPNFNFQFGFGLAQLDVFYEFEYKGYAETTGIKPVTTHSIGLAAMLLF
ncbi:MAG: hypothetical protein LBG57_04355 [Treponema sp.]|jgi:hypothetical protein|nr:hypothetical protein [Treponema sp.]